MKTYTIQNAYPDCLEGDEIEILSDNLRYAELGTTHSGVQCNQDNQEAIHVRCIKISKLIKEIDKLNK